jgi:hypothetical protein
VDSVAVYVGQQINMVASEGFIAIFAILSTAMIIWLKPCFDDKTTVEAQGQTTETGTG